MILARNRPCSQFNGFCRRIASPGRQSGGAGGRQSEWTSRSSFIVSVHLFYKTANHSEQLLNISLLSYVRKGKRNMHNEQLTFLPGFLLRLILAACGNAPVIHTAGSQLDTSPVTTDIPVFVAPGAVTDANSLPQLIELIPVPGSYQFSEGPAILGGRPSWTQTSCPGSVKRAAGRRAKNKRLGLLEALGRASCFGVSSLAYRRPGNCFDADG